MILACFKHFLNFYYLQKFQNSYIQFRRENSKKKFLVRFSKIWKNCNRILLSEMSFKILMEINFVKKFKRFLTVFVDWFLLCVPPWKRGVTLLHFTRVACSSKAAVRVCHNGSSATTCTMLFSRPLRLLRRRRLSKEQK